MDAVHQDDASRGRAFLANEAVFGPLAANPRFQQAFAWRLKIVQDQGVRAAIDSYLSG